MIARVTTLTRQGDGILVTVSYIDNTDPENLVEITSKSFSFSEGTTTQQARYEIEQAGRTLNVREREMKRLETALAPGTELVV